MPWCSKCSRYAQTAELRRLPNRNDESIQTYHCKDRAACRTRITDGDSGKAQGEPRGSQPRPADTPNLLERARMVYQLIRDGEIDGVLGLSYIVWPPEMDAAPGTPARDKRRRAA